MCSPERLDAVPSYRVPAAMSVFVTGTGTGVGKTVACAALMRRYRDLPFLRYWKPVQTGAPPDDDAQSVRIWSRAGAAAILPNQYSFPAPRSPHLAAELANREISFADLCDRYKQHASAGPLLVEGAGGVLVPLNRRETWLDLFACVRPSIVLVASTALGTINHTLLSISELRRANLAPVGVIFCGRPDSDNIRTILDFGQVPNLGCFHFEPKADFPDVLDESGLDPGGLLLRCFS